MIENQAGMTREYSGISFKVILVLENLSEIHFWNDFNLTKKKEKLSMFLQNFNDIDYLVDYFDNFRDHLSKNNLNSYLKSVSNL